MGRGGPGRGWKDGIKPSLQQRLERYSTPEPNTGCILWTGGISSNGYSCMHLNGKAVPSHRVAYELAKGPIPLGLVLDHLCRTPLCINPDHLEPVSGRENVIRGNEARGPKTHCKRGHLLLHVLPNGKRKCKICSAAHSRRYRNESKLRMKKE